MLRITVAVIAFQLAAASVHAQKVDRMFDAPVGMMLNYVQPHRADAFESVMARVAEALAGSDNPDHRAMAEGWHLLKAREPGQNKAALYLWWIDPTVPNVNYTVSEILAEYYPMDEAASLYQSFSSAFAGGQSMVNMDRIFHFAALEQDRGVRPSIKTPTPAATGHASLIKQHCANEWPADFQMRAFCEKQQSDALDQLDQGRPNDIPSDAFQTIRNTCTEQWENDFQMRAFCERQQIDGYRAVR